LAHSEYLEETLNRLTDNWPILETKNMFGGIVYMINGNICLGIWQENLIVRIGKEKETELKKEDWCIDFDITGKSMKGWAMITPDGWENREILERATTIAQKFTETLPVK
jgi:hypothetical protein